MASVQNPINSINPRKRREPQSQNDSTDRRTQVRADSLLSRIEDATYEIMRKHEIKSA